ncbi:MAG: hypothetical protein GVY09_18950 [Gammaproteobacteria bacterium]|nr:hypothetical protein [Gammaproteobacteria bacterium]
MATTHAATKRSGRYFILLFGYMMAQLAILPVFEANEALGAVSDLAYVVIVFYVAYAIRHSNLFWATAVFFGLTLVCYGVLVLHPHEQELFIALNFVAGAFLVTVIISLVTFILRQDRITLAGVLGGLCVYLLIGSAFTVAYINVELLSPGSFDFGVHGSEPDVLQLYDLLYFYSFVSLLTIGYGDIVPLSNLAQSLSVLEGVIGQFYLVFYMAVLVGMYVYGRQSAEADGER